MRVIVVGTPRQRHQLRAALESSPPHIVAEFASYAEARQSGLADAVLMAAQATEDEDALVEPITPRELQVLELVAEGLPNKAIAERLGISDQTVKFHIAASSGKLGAANRTDAVRRAVRRGLITL
jgi:DNA-binding NarL/FixJ family response regulator